MKKIIGIGNALVDVLTILNDDKILEKFSLPKGSMQLVDRDKSEQIKSETKYLKPTLISGGSNANTIHGLAMLGVDAGFIGSIGLDETGDFYEQDMKNGGVNTMLFRKTSVTGTAVVLITPDSERTFAVHLGAAAELDAKDLKPALFSGYDILYVEGYLINNLSLIETACIMAKEQNMIIALDLSSYNVVEANLTGFKRIVEGYVDIIFANEEEAKAYTGLIPREALNLLSETNEVVVIKVGADGSWLKRREEIVKISSLPVSCNDTTGAGDLYASGFLYGIANGLDLEKCGTIGSLMAGKVIEIIGARMEEARFKEIKKTIKTIIESD